MSQPLDERGLPAGYQFRPEWEWTPRAVRDARTALGEPILLLDCRTDQERAIATIDGSMHVPLHDLERKLDDIRDAAEDLGTSTIVVHCHHGMRSLRAAAVLRAAGFPTAASMAGGIDLWSTDIDPRVPRY
ncbi:MAG: rhodanese [Phycisphaerae bacterium]|nr:rhodanese [Phycisphaerae bacterium]